MNDLQRAVIAAADAKIRPAMELYELRSEVFRKVCKVDREPLRRLVQVLQKLTPDELTMVLGYAEGLAAWSSTEQESPDASNTQPHAAAPGPGSG